MFNFWVPALIETHCCQASAWISCIMTRAAAWWTCLQRRLLITADYLHLNYCIVSRSRMFLYTDCCFACFTSYLAHLLGEIIKRCFWFARPTPPSCLLSPPIPLCFHFSSQEVIYRRTHSNSQPQLHTLIYPNRPGAFIFAHFLTSFLFLPWWSVTASVCFFRLISSSVICDQLSSVLVPLWLWGLLVLPSCVFPYDCTVCVCFFLIGCWEDQGKLCISLTNHFQFFKSMKRRAFFVAFSSVKRISYSILATRAQIMHQATVLWHFLCWLFQIGKTFSFLWVTLPSTSSLELILSFFVLSPLYLPTCFPPLLPPLPSCLCIRVKNILFMAAYWQRHSWSGSACGPAAPALFMPLSWLGSRALEQMAAVFNWTLPLYHS